jgi:hypothetical protein
MRVSSLLSRLSFAVLLAATARPAFAQSPSPGNSTCPTLVAVGTTGSCCFDVIVRDLANNLIANATVSVDFANCGVQPCPVQAPGLVVVGSTVRTSTDASGVAHFCICVPAPLPFCTVSISAEGVPLCLVPVTACPSAPGDTCTTAGWRDLTAFGPDARVGSAMVRHDTRGSLLLFGGFTSAGEANDTWEWDGDNWLSHGNAASPLFARRDHAMAYDRARDRVVLFGGAVLGVRDGNTFEWSPSTGWQLVSSTGPSERSGHVMAFDENLGKVILFGGQGAGGALGDTWGWDGSNWALHAATGPPARMLAAMASDPERKRIVLFGGSTQLAASSSLTDTWEWDGAQWTEFTAPGPAARRSHAMAFADQSSRMILFGGESPSGGLEPTTWSWNGFSWRAEPDGPATSSPVMAYDYARGLMTAFGGSRSAQGNHLTSQLCCVCDDEAMAIDTTGTPIYPPTLDPDEPITDEIVEEDRGDIEDLYPDHHTSADTWLKDFPCATAIGGTIPPEASNPAWDDSLLALGINGAAQDIADSLDSWEQQIGNMYAGEADGLAGAPPVGFGPYPLPPEPWCPPDSGKYIFGGRDIIFIHGLMLKHVFQRMFLNPGALEDWRPPTAGQSAESLNPEFYLDTGFYRGIALDNWGEHIQAFFDSKGIKNRFLIVSYPCNDRLEVGIQAVLTQISDAMRTGKNVKNPANASDVGGFGTPSFVIVSHSTGGLMGATAMYAAKHYPNLNAEFIAERCKAHVAIAGAFSGSRLATAAIAVTGAVSAASTYYVGWLCPLFNIAMSFFVDNIPPCPIVASVALRSVLVDLVPAVTKAKWGDEVEGAGIRTVLVTGGHPTHTWPLKNILHRGFDDGVLTTNCTSANPGTTFLWPSGFIANWGPLGIVRTYDQGMEYRDSSTLRSARYFHDQVMDRYLTIGTRFIPFYVASGPIPYLSPTGMLQSVGLEFDGENGFNPLRRYPLHYSFMASAAEHPGIRSGEDRPDYKPTLGLISNWEESRTIREVDEAALRERYSPEPVVYQHDDQPLLTDACKPRVDQWTIGRRLNFKIKGFSGKKFPKRGWIWKRHYMRPQGIFSNHIIDYTHASILACEPIQPWCDGTTGVGETKLMIAGATTHPNPAVRRVNFDFTLGRAGYADLTILDASGRRVRRLLGRELTAGQHRVAWDGLDQSGARVAAGVYFWKLRAAGAESVQRVVLMR